MELNTIIIWYMIVSAITPTGNEEITRYEFKSLETCEAFAHYRLIQLHDMGYTKQTVRCVKEVTNATSN